MFIEVSPSRGPETRLGITVSRRFGKAVQRVYFKRMIREAFRLTRSELPEGLDFNVRPRIRPGRLDLSLLIKDLKKLLHLAHSKFEKETNDGSESSQSSSEGSGSND